MLKYNCVQSGCRLFRLQISTQIYETNTIYLLQLMKFLQRDVTKKRKPLRRFFCYNKEPLFQVQLYMQKLTKAEDINISWNFKQCKGL